MFCLSLAIVIFKVHTFTEALHENAVDAKSTEHNGACQYYYWRPL